MERISWGGGTEGREDGKGKQEKEQRSRGADIK